MSAGSAVSEGAGAECTEVFGACRSPLRRTPGTPLIDSSTAHGTPLIDSSTAHGTPLIDAFTLLSSTLHCCA